jgi:hypothetical protein
MSVEAKREYRRDFNARRDAGLALFLASMFTLTLPIHLQGRAKAVTETKPAEMINIGPNTIILNTKAGRVEYSEYQTEIPREASNLTVSTLNLRGESVSCELIKDKAGADTATKTVAGGTTASTAPIEFQFMLPLRDMTVKLVTRPKPVTDNDLSQVPFTSIRVKPTAAELALRRENAIRDTQKILSDMEKDRTIYADQRQTVKPVKDDFLLQQIASVAETCARKVPLPIEQANPAPILPRAVMPGSPTDRPSRGHVLNRRITIRSMQLSTTLAA